MSPVIDEIEKEFPNIQVVRVNADEDAAMVQKYNVSSIPTYVLEKDDGEIISFATGAMPKYKFIKEMRLDNVF
jgi:thioredoxin-related protein